MLSFSRFRDASVFSSFYAFERFQRQQTEFTLHTVAWWCSGPLYLYLTHNAVYRGVLIDSTSLPVTDSYCYLGKWLPSYPHRHAGRWNNCVTRHGRSCLRQSDTPSLEWAWHSSWHQSQCLCRAVVHSCWAGYCMAAKLGRCTKYQSSNSSTSAIYAISCMSSGKTGSQTHLSLNTGILRAPSNRHNAHSSWDGVHGTSLVCLMTASQISYSMDNN